MTGKQIPIAIVGIVVGFILGFFTSQFVQGPSGADASQLSADSALPGDHPSPEAMAEIQQLLQEAEAHPEDRQIRVALGNRFYDMQRFDLAIPWYEEALQMEEQDIHVSTDLGTSYLYVGNVEGALDQYEKSLLIEPDHPQTLQNMGIAHFAAGDYQQAIDVWERLLRIHPDYAHVEDVRRQIETARTHLTTEAAAP